MYRLYCLRGYSVKSPTVITGILILYATSIILVKIQGVVQCLPIKYNCIHQSFKKKIATDTFILWFRSTYLAVLKHVTLNHCTVLGK